MRIIRGLPNWRTSSVYCTDMSAWVSYKNNDPTENVFVYGVRGRGVHIANRRRAAFWDRSRESLSDGRSRAIGHHFRLSLPVDIGIRGWHMSGRYNGYNNARVHNRGSTGRFIFSPFFPDEAAVGVNNHVRPGFDVVSRTHGPESITALPNPTRVFRRRVWGI